MNSFIGILRMRVRGSMVRRGVFSVGVVVLVLCVCCGVASQAFGLPADRVYEQVSPSFKGGYGVAETSAVAPNGEGVAFVSQGAFAGALFSGALGNTYFAQRGTGGWVTSPLVPPAALVPAGFTADFSSGLEYTLFKGYPGPNAGAEFKENSFLVHATSVPDTEKSWEPVGGGITAVNGQPLNVSYPGASADLCHILINEVGSEPLLSPGEGSAEQLYELLRGCHEEPAGLRLIALDNQGNIIDPGCEPTFGGRRMFNTISAGGSEIFFSDSVDPAEGGKCLNNVHDPKQLFVRLNGTSTLEISAPLSESESCVEVPCPGAAKRAPASFEGANEEGTVVFFTTVESLASTDMDKSNDLYMAKVGCPGGEAEACEVAQRKVTSLVQVSKGMEPAEVQGVVRVAPDGSRVYFVARGVLTSEGPKDAEAEGAQSQPVRGAENLYMYEGASGKLVFVADLCSAPSQTSGEGLSGIAADSRCPANEGFAAQREDVGLWSRVEPEAQSTPDGGVLLVSSYGRLLANDTNNARDVYRYEAVSGTLERVSIGEGGHDANGNSDDTPTEPTVADAAIEPYEGQRDRVYEQHEMRTRAMNEAGTRIVFESSAPLSPAAINRHVNIYEWHEGIVSLVSSGNAQTNDCCAVMSPDGDNIFFTTAQGLVPGDTDGATDIYDARMDGGFPLASALPRPCEGDGCQGPLTNPAPLLVPGSVPQVPGGNFAPPVSKPVKAKAKPKKKGKPRKTNKKKIKKKGKASGYVHRAGKASGGDRP
ncbi:MAG TPA: hypothetical protein VIJ39_10410 [Solirubrobacteraceae bacterium]